MNFHLSAALIHQHELFSTQNMEKSGRPLPAVNRFPSAANGMGFKPLADYIHSPGLKFGIYIMRGRREHAAGRLHPVGGILSINHPWKTWQFFQG